MWFLFPSLVVGQPVLVEVRFLLALSLSSLVDDEANNDEGENCEYSRGISIWQVQIVVMGKCPETTAHVVAKELLGQ